MIGEAIDAATVVVVGACLYVGAAFALVALVVVLVGMPVGSWARGRLRARRYARTKPHDYQEAA